MSYDVLSVLNPYADDDEFDAALDELIDRGLIFFDQERGRYDLHPIVRQYAYDRLTDKKGVHSRLRDYFAAVPVPEKEKVQSLDDLAPVIELYHHTVRAGRYHEAFDLFRDRLSDPLYFRFGAYQTCIELLRALFPVGASRSPRLKDEIHVAWTLNALALSYGRSGQPRRAGPLLEQQNDIQWNHGNRRNLTIGLGNLAIQQIDLGDLTAAEASLRRRIALCRQMRAESEVSGGQEVRGEWNEAIGHQELGRLLAYQGAFEKAAWELDTALTSFQEVTDRQSECIVWAYRALRALLMGEAKAALEFARRARELADEVARTRYPHERDIIRAEWLMGAALVAVAGEKKGGQSKPLADAERHLTEAINRCRRINLLDLEPDILLAWARWRRARGDPQQARRDAEEALAITDRCEYRLKQADARNLLAQLALDDGDSKAARQHAKIARDHAWCGGPPHCYKPALDEAEGLLAAAS